MIEELNLTPEQVFAEGGSKLVLEAAEAEAKAFVPDVTTEAGRKAIASKAYQMARFKTRWDDAGKDYAEDLKKKTKVIDGERKKIREGVEALQDAIRKPLNEFEAREAARVQLIKEQLESLSAYQNLPVDCTAADIQGRIDAINGFNFNDWQEFESQAKTIKANTLTSLGEALERAKKAEAERAELERLRREAEERRVKEEQERIAREAAEKARKEAEDKAAKEAAEAARKAAEEKAEIERKAKEEQEARERAEREAAEAAARAKEAEEKAERDRIEAEERAKRDREAAEQEAKRRELAAAEAERQRIAAEQAEEKRQAEEREKDIEHRKAVNNAALKAIVEHSGITEEQAKKVVIAIASGMVPSVKVFY